MNETTLIHELVDEMATRMPGQTAVVFGSRSRTYRDLSARTARLAQFLKHHRVGPETLVAIGLGRGIGYAGEGDVLTASLVGARGCAASPATMSDASPRGESCWTTSNSSPTASVLLAPPDDAARWLLDLLAISLSTGASLSAAQLPPGCSSDTGLRDSSL